MISVISASLLLRNRFDTEGVRSWYGGNPKKKTFNFGFKGGYSRSKGVIIPTPVNKTIVDHLTQA